MECVPGEMVELSGLVELPVDELSGADCIYDCSLCKIRGRILPHNL